MKEITRTWMPEGDAESIAVRSYRLTLSSEEGAERSHLLESRLVHLGSSPDCEVVLDDVTVSRSHAFIEVDATGHRLRDLGSKNGTWINNVRVKDAYLPSEAVLRFGGVEVAFSIEDKTVEVPISARRSFGGLIGESLQMREIFGRLERVANTDVTVLIEGQSGTGKELVARAIHDHSDRRKGPFTIFDCSAVAANLIESELFGHVRGAFTGADSDRKGAFQEARGGTLFIDEIGELDLKLQPKLLRALESKEVKSVGSNDRLRIDARIVVATNRDLVQEVESGQFREDLYYRLAVLQIRLPPLARRKEDIPILVRHFLKELGAQEKGLEVSYETMLKLEKHPWPGNVRELRNFLERALVLSEGGRIETRFVEGSDGLSSMMSGLDGSVTEGEALPADFSLPFKDAKARLLDAFSIAYWSRLLEACDGNISEAARQGGVHRKSLEYLMKKLDLRSGGQNA